MIDSHVHLVTSEMFDDLKKRYEKSYPGSSESLIKNASHLINNSFLEFLAKTSIDEFAQIWIEEMDKNGIEIAVFFPISEKMEQIGEFLQKSPDRFRGYAYLNDPLAEDAPQRLRGYVDDYGIVGLKLYPCIQLFHAYDPKLFPLYEEAQDLGIPITFHMGITHAPTADYRYTNPLDLQAPLKLFSKLNFIIAHFGAGFFREACLVSYHTDNLYLDTSGTNNWREYTPENLELKEVFRRALDIFGPSRILFGTDTVMRPDTRYRGAIMEEQRAIVESLCRDESDANLILHENAAELFG
jgi:hypothetical protein